jgi:hypothetical protein
MTTKNSNEPGYEAVIVRTEVKACLNELRKSLDGRDLIPFRCLATAALEVAMESAQNDPEVLSRLRKRALSIARDELDRVADAA